MKKVLYIAGLGHSGSTILDMSLGCQENIIGLGEVSAMLETPKDNLYNSQLEKYFCSCGCKMSECSFWSKARPILANTYNQPQIERYLRLINLFCEMYGENTILVDSSKFLSSWLAKLEERGVDLKVVFLVRDFRSWCYSRHSRLGSSSLILALRWLKGNLSTEKKLKTIAPSYITIGYEEFALYPEHILKIICKHTNVNYSNKMLQPTNTSSHILRGNVVRGDKKKSSRIQYDARWFTSNRMNLLAVFCFPLIRKNNKWVYSNFIQGTSKAFGKKQMDFVEFGDKAKEHIRKKIEGR